jgi:ABC-type transporter Mla subunit MlaD
MRRILATAAVLIAVGAFLLVTLGSTSTNTGTATYNVELDNAFGLVNGSDFKVAGVIAGSIQSINLCYSVPHAHCQSPLDALIAVSVNRTGFGQFHTDAFCQSRPQSLIGEYFLDCDPGTTGKVLKPGSTIPVTQTQSTIPADLIQNVMRLPYRERFSIIINELGAAVAARSQDLASALRRPDPALAETDNLLNLLANDSQTIKSLNVNANQVITALANNNQEVQRFIVQADNVSTDSATQASNIQKTWEDLPGFLQQLRPAMQKLGAAADAQTPVFENLNAAADNLTTFFKQLTPFSNSSRVSLTCGENGQPGCPNGGASLGTVAKTGTPAVKDATPTVKALNNFTGGVNCSGKIQCLPELSQNLSIVLQALDTQTRTQYGGGAVEADPRSPNGGKGYTGLQALLQYAFNITTAVNYFGPFGHMLGVDAFANADCSPYATPASIATNLSQYQSGASSVNPRSCYSFLGPNQPGVNETDPSNPSGCVPDPGGAPVQGYGTSYSGPKTSACKLSASPSLDLASALTKSSSGSSLSASSGGGGAGGGSSGVNLGQTLSQLLSAIGGGSKTSNAASSATGAATSAPSSAASSAGQGAGQSSGANSSGSGAQTQQLLNYLLAP